MGPVDAPVPARAGRDYSYEEIVELCRRSEYPHSVIRSASGRLNRLLGVEPALLRRLEAAARDAGVGLALVGSRVSGPRSRQRGLHPALARLALSTRYRHASALLPSVQGVEIAKTSIKEYGPDDPRTSDLSVLVLDPRRSPEGAEALAADLEREFGAAAGRFRIRFFGALYGTLHRGEADWLATGERYLRTTLPEGVSMSPEELREGFRELYATLNVPRPSLGPADVRNGLVGAVLFSASVSPALGFHAVLPAVGFGFGLLGRHLARLKAWVAFSLGDGVAANAAAVLADAGIGAAVMACVINPLAGLGLSLERVLLGSVLHSQAKGPLRVFVDKTFSALPGRRQGTGVLVGMALNSVQVAVTGFVYAGRPWAVAVQGAFCAAGLWLLFGPPLRRWATRRTA